MLTNTDPVQNQPLKFANKTVENSTPDPFTMVDGHYIGHDGFVVPQDFDEFGFTKLMRPLPEKMFPPLFVMALITPPVNRPYSAGMPDVRTWVS